jgi:hypothetical protein
VFWIQLISQATGVGVAYVGPLCPGRRARIYRIILSYCALHKVYAVHSAPSAGTTSLG